MSDFLFSVNPLFISTKCQYAFCLTTTYRSVIAYGDNERMIGESAVAQMRGNFKNTIPYINRFVGLTSECKEQIEEESKFISNKTSFGDDKKLNFSVTNKGEAVQLAPEQIYSAYL